MKQIDQYINSIYKETSGNNQDTKELKEEMRSHLIEAVHELKEEGYAEQEAINIAIERFGGEQEVSSIILKLTKVKKKFEKKIILSAVAILLLGTVLSVVFLLMDWHNTTERQEFANSVLGKLGAEQEISEETEQFMTSVLESNINFYEMSATFVKDDPWKEFSGGSEYHNKDRAWFTNWLIKDGEDYRNGYWIVDIWMTKFTYLSVGILGGSISIFLALLLVWIIMKRYRIKREV
ncbi:permease prefix domain 1-containing protein [Chengkuizengella axinellae]|uniref:Permease prefix domain 1-containing protein n=1 Tax=Chengkuizengella axinellae TaxID=3064388 RepID=A0ABT9J0T8_9BACL|nr:permease prefix domain 1-containing protein [Chengkuizengella sp. 2205SS18-9]MDP5275229.1 permease prefix domain 1-containing protein [Chengkuizengella sp. 2205SS18-9]